MKTLIMDKFGGLAPKLGEDLPFGLAQTAENVDLRSGKIRPVKEPLLIEAQAANYNSIIKFGDIWLYGSDRHFFDTVLNNVEMLFYIENNVLKKKIGDDVADVGHDPPDILGVTSPAGAGSAGTYTYIITTVRNVGSFQYSNEDGATSEEDWGPKASGGKNVDESNVDYSPNPPAAGDVILATAAGYSDGDRVPATHDEDVNGLQSGDWSDVDEYPYNDYTDWILMGNGSHWVGGPAAGAVLASIPDSEVYSVVIESRANINGNFYGRLMVSGSSYNHPDRGTIGGASTFYTDLFEWAVNPKTGSPWTRADLDNIQGFGIWSANAGGFTGCRLIVRFKPFEATGYIETEHDLTSNAITGGQVKFTVGSNIPPDTSIVHTAKASNTGAFAGEETDLGTVEDDDMLAVYRFYRTKAALATTDTDVTPIYQWVNFFQEGAAEAISDESGPSEPSNPITITGSEKVVITIDTTYDPYITHWRIYRISENTESYQFVAEVAIATTTYDDEAADADLSGAPNAWFTSDQGNLIIFAKAPPLDGLMQGIHGGMLVGWKGSNLIWCEPGSYDAWPAYYSALFPANIKDVISFAGTIAVLTEAGPLRVDGTHPELLVPSKVLGEEPCTGRMGTVSNQGVFYLSDSGIVLFNLADTKLVSGENFSEEYFAAIDRDTITLAENDEIIYLFHDNGTIVLDQRGIVPYWNTFNLPIYGAWKDPIAGVLYVMDDAGVNQWAGGADNLPWIWKSGKIVGKREDLKHFYGIRVVGSDPVTGKIILDDVDHGSRLFGLAVERGMRFFVPRRLGANSLEVELTGTGEVDELQILFQA